jgi:hypothetical protein
MARDPLPPRRARPAVSIGTRVLSGCLLAVAIRSLPAGAGEATAQFQVRATVLARALIVSEEHPPFLEVTAEDVTRGNLRAGSTVVWRTNDRAGVRMMFMLSPGPLSSALVSNDRAELRIGAAEGWLAEPFSGTAPTTTRVTYTIDLCPELLPGVYEWPVHLTVVPASQ